MIIYKATNLTNGKICIGLDTKEDPNYYGLGNYIKAEKNMVKKISYSLGIE